MRFVGTTTKYIVAKPDAEKRNIGKLGEGGGRAGITGGTELATSHASIVNLQKTYSINFVDTAKHANRHCV
jgi:hypothetical protein